MELIYDSACFCKDERLNILFEIEWIYYLSLKPALHDA